MKILFILHSTNIEYGAARSVRYILQNTEDSYDVVCSYILRIRYTEQSIRDYIGSSSHKIFYANLPNELYSVFPLEKPDISWRYIRKCIRLKIQKLLAYIDKYRIYRIIEHGKYDLVYLNSISLYPIITDKYKFVMHAREIYSGYDLANFYKKLALLKGIIYIDEAVKKSITINNIPRITLNNPFDMLAVRNIDVQSIRHKYCIKSSDIVFAIIGAVTPSKGVDFVINAIHRSCVKSIKLLVVGEINSQYAQNCLKLAEKDPRIMFLGTIVEIENIYSILDYIIRADSVFCIGRTVYEALYAGCGVIIQGDDSDVPTMPQYELFKDKIYCYRPRDDNSLVEQIKLLSHKKITDRKYYSNVDEYIKQFELFLDSVVTSKREAEKC